MAGQRPQGRGQRSSGGGRAVSAHPGRAAHSGSRIKAQQPAARAKGKSGRILKEDAVVNINDATDVFFFFCFVV